MSQTISVGVFEPVYWSYMAAVMAERLDGIARKKRVELNDIPKGVYYQAEEFLHLVLQTVGDTLPDNPAASIKAYTIAADAMRRALPSVFESRQELKDCLRQLSHFVESLQRPRELTEEEVEMAINFRKFFLRLHQMGEAEAYEQRIRFDTSPIGLWP